MPSSSPYLLFQSLIYATDSYGCQGFDGDQTRRRDARPLGPVRGTPHKPTSAVGGGQLGREAAQLSARGIPGSPLRPPAPHLRRVSAGFLCSLVPAPLVTSRSPWSLITLRPFPYALALLMLCSSLFVPCPALPRECTLWKDRTLVSLFPALCPPQKNALYSHSLPTERAVLWGVGLGVSEGSEKLSRHSDWSPRCDDEEATS